MANGALLILTDDSRAVFPSSLLPFAFLLLPSSYGRGRDHVVYGPDFADEVLVLFERQCLRAVREGAFGVIVDFDDEAVRPGGDARARERHLHVVVTGAVRRVNDDGQVGDTAAGWDGREVERVARV